MMNNLTYLGLSIKTWYTSLTLPFWAPPVWLFSVAWGIIYPIMVVSFSYVFWQSFVKHTLRRYVGALFAINLVFNLIYTIGTFTVFTEDKILSDIDKIYWPAALVITVVLITLPAMILATWERARWVALAQIPYLLWVIVATALQYTIIFTN